MLPVLIFEGHDRSGKTTIANRLAERFDTEVFTTNSKECFTDKGAFGKDSSGIALFNYHIASYCSSLIEHKVLNKPIIIYRSFLSEMVYSKLLGRKTFEVINIATDIMYSRINATVILCKNNRESFNDELLDDKLIKKSVKLYDELKFDLSCDVLEIDTSEHNVELYVDNIISYLKQK